MSAGTPTTGSFDVLPELLCKGRWALRFRFLYIYVFISEFIARNESSGLSLCIATSILHMCCAASITTSNLAGSGHLLNNIIALCTEFMTYCKVDSIINICIRGVLHQPVHCWFHTAVVGPVNSFACSLAGEALLIALSCQQTTCAWFAKKCRLIFYPRRCCGHRGSNKMSYDKLDIFHARQGCGSKAHWILKTLFNRLLWTLRLHTRIGGTSYDPPAAQILEAISGSLPMLLSHAETLPCAWAAPLLPRQGAIRSSRLTR